jgi:hypothetical protein
MMKKNFVYQTRARNYYYCGGENGEIEKEGNKKHEKDTFHHSCDIFMITK